MRRRAAALLAGCLLVGVSAACSGDDESSRSAAVERLVELCDAARTDVEALGLPSEAGPGVLLPWADRGSRLAKDVGALRGSTAAEQRRLRALGRALDEYYRGLRLGHAVYTQTKSLEAYAAAIRRATTFLEDAEGLANALGAPECAIRPFPER